MSATDASSVRADRVREARRRLEEAAAGRDGRSEPVDHAVRMVRLDPPILGSSSLVLHPNLAIVAGLVDQARDSLAATVAALHDNDRRSGLDGSVVIDGEVRPIRAEVGEAPTQGAGAAAMFRAPDPMPPIAASESHALRSVIDHLEAAVALTEAELRGADEVARSLRDPSEVDVDVDLTSNEPLGADERSELADTLDAMTAIQPDPELLAELERRLEEVGDPRRALALDSAVAQYEAARSALLPSDSVAVRAGLEEALVGAMEERDVHVRRRQDAERAILAIADTLDYPVPPDADAAVIARRILDEAAELTMIRHRLERRLEGTPVVEPPVHPRLASLDAERENLRRRLRSQKQVRATARELLARTEPGPDAWVELPGRASTPVNSEGRPMPVLVEEPLVDLPLGLGAIMLSVLLRMSEVTQVICISDQPDVEEWCATVGNRAGYTLAAGWFAGEDD